VSYFSAAEKRRIFVHVSHTLHHKFTTKAPHQTATFSQNTPVKQPQFNETPPPDFSNEKARPKTDALSSTINLTSRE
jgi:hypothetical protein